MQPPVAKDKAAAVAGSSRVSSGSVAVGAGLSCCCGGGGGGGWAAAGIRRQLHGELRRRRTTLVARLSILKNTFL